MKRRHFILNTILGGAAIGLHSCSSNETKDEGNSKTAQSFVLEEMNVPELQKLIKNGTYSSEKITQLYIQRIKNIDHAGINLRSVIEINPDAILIAQELDKERAEGKTRGPLHGIPVLIKENIDTGDKQITSAGSVALSSHKAKTDAFIVEQLRAAGMVLLGKTNLSEWANFRSTNSSSGWSSRGGQTRNPYVLDRTPCGSSAGSAVAISANLAPLAIGTETDGSIVCPSGINGVVGIKPTVGLWSRSGIIPISHSQDTAGPMGKSVLDAALLLQALTAKDEHDKASQAQPDELNIYLNFDRNTINSARIGYMKQYSAFDKRVAKIMDETISKLEEAGAIIVDIDNHEEANEIGQYEWTVLLYEFKDGINNYLKSHPEIPINSLSELITFNKENHKAAMPWFSQEILEMANETSDLNDKKYLEAKKLCKELAQDKGIDKLIETHQLDALMAPTNGPAWTIDYVNGDNFKGGSSTLAAVSGYPSVTVPAGNILGLPIGVSFFGKAWTESRLIQIAHVYEQASKQRIVPTFKTSLLDEE
ncbi:amidase [Carboxylicivirga sp. N1Y90]|uniref:amidase n=1 Tax=Carboxylicivirga fragile TaxID=3417571 RepID=UPI003D32BBBD|nr:amidase [Marinilabiliaceae bacterium N1Y90]